MQNRKIEDGTILMSPDWIDVCYHEIVSHINNSTHIATNEGEAKRKYTLEYVMCNNIEGWHMGERIKGIYKETYEKDYPTLTMMSCSMGCDGLVSPDRSRKLDEQIKILKTRYILLLNPVIGNGGDLNEAVQEVRNAYGQSALVEIAVLYNRLGRDIPIQPTLSFLKEVEPLPKDLEVRLETKNNKHTLVLRKRR